MKYMENLKSERGSVLTNMLLLVVLVAFGAVAYISGQKDVLSKFTTAMMQSEMANVVRGKQTEQVETDPGLNPVVAKVNGEEIRRNEVLALVQQMPPQMQQIPIEQLLPMSVDQLITNALVDEQAAQANLGNDPEVREEVSKIKDQIIRAKYVEREIDSRLTEERVQVAYQEYVDNFPETEEVKAAHILVDEKAVAEDVISRLKDGADFAELAKELSKDGTALNGGDLGFFAKGEVVPAFEDAAFNADVGLIDKPVQSQFGFHVIRVDEKRIRPVEELAVVEPFLRQEMQRQIFEEAVAEWKEAANIERFDINGNPLGQQEPAAGDVQDSNEEPEQAESNNADADADAQEAFEESAE